MATLPFVSHLMTKWKIILALDSKRRAKSGSVCDVDADGFDVNVGDGLRSPTGDFAIDVLSMKEQVGLPESNKVTAVKTIGKRKPLWEQLAADLSLNKKGYKTSCREKPKAQASTCSHNKIAN